MNFFKNFDDIETKDLKVILDELSDMVVGEMLNNVKN